MKANNRFSAISPFRGLGGMGFGFARSAEHPVRARSAEVSSASVSWPGQRTPSHQPSSVCGVRSAAGAAVPQRIWCFSWLFFPTDALFGTAPAAGSKSIVRQRHD
jgi:hypothetical protein